MPLNLGNYRTNYTNSHGVERDDEVVKMTETLVPLRFPRIAGFEQRAWMNLRHIHGTVLKKDSWSKGNKPALGVRTCRASCEALILTTWVLNGEGRFGSAGDCRSVIIQLRYLSAAAAYREP